MAVVTLSCGLELRGTGEPTSDAPHDEPAPGASDASLDRAEPADAGGEREAASTVDARPEAAVDADPGDGGLVFTCRGTPTADCSSCTGLTLPCVYCATSGPGLRGVCSAAGVNCFTAEPLGFHVCPCTYPSASACPMPWQTCHKFGGFEDCYTCGEIYSDEDTCKSGGSCNESGRTCR